MPSTYQLISSNVLSSSAASVTFSAIPSTFTDLVVRMSLRNSFTGAQDFKVNLNGDTSSTFYSSTKLDVYGGSPSSERSSNRPMWELQNCMESNSATANTFGSVEMYIPSYLSNANKVGSIDLRAEDNSNLFVGGGGFAQIAIGSHLWRNTAAITSISISSNLLSGSSFYLYGIKNS
jgi:hypothetical protein